MGVFMDVNWNEVWNNFWKRYKGMFPKEWELEEEVSKRVEDIWKKISPEKGRFERSELAIDNSGRVTGAMVDFILMGAILSVMLSKTADGHAKADEVKKLREEISTLREQVKKLKKK